MDYETAEDRPKPIDVFEKIVEVKNKYFSFGLKLGLEEHEVEGIELKCRNDPSECLLHVLIECDRRARLTWKPIISALKSSALNFVALAKSLEDQFCQQGSIDAATALPNPSTSDGVSEVKEEIGDFKDRFKYLKNSTRKHFENEKVPVKDVAEELTAMSCDAADVHKLFFKECFRELFDADDHVELFGRMNFHWNYLTYQPLDHLVKSFKIDHVGSEMELYKSDLKVFMKKTPLTIFCKAQEKKCTKSTTKFRKLVARFNLPENVTLEVADNFRKDLAHHYRLWECAMMLEEVRPGSFIITWLVPKSIVEIFKSNLPNNVLTQYCVSYLEVDGTTVYSEKESYAASSSGYVSEATSTATSPTSYLERSESRQDGAVRDCTTYKFLGSCRKGLKCNFRHHTILSPAYRKTLSIPAGMTAGMVIGSGGYNLKQLRSIAPCSVIVDNALIVIGTNSERNLELLLQKLNQILSQEHVSGPSMNYIHPKGIYRHGIYYFRLYCGRIPVRVRGPKINVYELCLKLTPETESYGDDDVVQIIAAQSPITAIDSKEGLQRQVRQLHGENLGEHLLWTQNTRVHLNPHKKIHEGLQAVMEVLCEKQKEYSLRLDARFGKFNWSKFPEEVYQGYYSVQELTSLLFSKDSRHKGTFNSDVQKASGRDIHARLKQYPYYSNEVLDIKVTCLTRIGGEDGARLDIKLMINRSEAHPEVLLVKKNDVKDITYDVLNLHRKHDFRIGLQHYKCVEEGEPLYGVVKELVEKMTFPSGHRVRFQPKTSRWNVHLIRHKQSTTYLMDEGFAVAVTNVIEHSLDVGKDKEVEFDLGMEKNEKHTEVELHNLAWECAFGRDAGLSPEQSLAIHMEPGSVDVGQFDTIPHPWETASILRDFTTFWRHLEALVELLD